jgi:catechol 2,3-dioxygenase
LLILEWTIPRSMLLSYSRALVMPTDGRVFTIDAMTHIGAVTLQVADLARSEEFYTETIGLKAMPQEGNTKRLSTADGLPMLELHERVGANPRPRQSTGLYHLAILAPSRAALGMSLRRLVEKGYPLHGAADHLVSEALYLDDPDKNGIEIYRDRPKEEWQFNEGFVRMGNEPVDLASLFTDAGDQAWEGLQAGTTMGHIHLHVRDLGEAEEFYCGVLGFDVMLRWPPSALFISAGGYHHHIGLNTWAGEGAPPPPADAAGLQHYQIVLADDKARSQVIERLRFGKVPLSEMAEGFLLKDPSGNGILLCLESLVRQVTSLP